jgi:multiple sugar transport system permease protein/raffinose/stachyose/melibiose transport system permease protein
MLWVTFPFLWALSCALRPIERLFTTTPEWLPHPLTLENFQWALNEPSFTVPIINSCLVASASAAAAVALGALAAYSLTRLTYPGKAVVMTGMLACQMLPTMLVIIPIFLMFARVDLYNTLGGLILASTAWTLPYSVMLLRSFFSALPVTLEEQAMVDGCSRLGAFIRITIPLSMPGIAAVTAYAFIWTWGDMLFPLILTKNLDHQTAALSLFTMMQSTRGATNYGGLLAAGILFTLPTVLLFFVLQRPMLEGLTGGALKD